MEKKVFTQEEIDNIKAIQDKYNTLGVQLVQLKLALKGAMDYVESLQLQESTIEVSVLLKIKFAPPSKTSSKVPTTRFSTSTAGFVSTISVSQTKKKVCSHTWRQMNTHSF